ncbi:MAG: VTT domain-containing protein [Pseudomonadota bacterium]
MMNQLDHYYAAMIQWLQHHPQWGVLAAFLIAFSESIPVIGLIIPGSVTMTVVGILIGSKVIPLDLTLIAAILGAIAGDTVGFILGYYYRDKIKNIWPFRKNPQWLHQGEAFIEKHGGKSIFIGRFVGVTRPFVPMVAGMLRMRVIKFYVADTPSAILWAIAYMLPGFLIGAISLSIPAGMEKKLFIGVIVVLLLIWLVTWMIAFAYRKISKYFYYLVNRVWYAMGKSQRWLVLRRLLRHPEVPEHHAGQFALLCLWLICSVLFVFFLVNTIFHNPVLDSWNSVTYNFFRSLNYPPTTKVMLGISTFGQVNVLFPMAIVILIYLMIRQQWYTALHWLLLLLLISVSTFVFKHLIYHPRPLSLAVAVPTSSSFPSGYVALSTALYGFMAYLICIGRPQWRTVTFRVVLTIVGLVALSRLYLCVHWLTDIIAGVFLGLACLFLVIVSHRRRQRFKLAVIPFLVTLFVAFGVFAAYYQFKNYTLAISTAKQGLQQRYVRETSWWTQKSSEIPLYHNNRFGHPDLLFNVQWAGSLDHIKYTLKQNGWQLAPIGYFMTLYKTKTNDNKAHFKPMITRRNHGELPVIVAVKQDRNGQQVILNLWSAHITLTPANRPLWVGTIYEHSQYSYHFWFSHHTLANMGKEIDMLTSQNRYKIKTIDANQLPERLRHKLNRQQYAIIMILGE